MKTKLTKQFEIHYQHELEDFVNKSIKIFDSKYQQLKDLFGDECEKVDILKASYFTKRENFVEYIKSVSNGKTPPDWATGCFYNGEIQTLLNPNNTEYHTYTLTHETIHLYIQRFRINK